MKIENDKLVIPDFQRGFKWKQPDIRKLLESLLLDFPIGSALLWKTERGMLEYRRIEAVQFEEDESANGDTSVSGRDESTEDIDFILDGQQRITSIFRLFPQTLAPTEAEIATNLKGIRYFLDLRKLGLSSEVLEYEKNIDDFLDPENVSDAIVEKRHPELRREFRSISGSYPQRLSDDDIMRICLNYSWLPLTRAFLENKQSHLQKIRRSVSNELMGSCDEDELERSLDSWVDWFTSTFQAILNRKSLPCITLADDKPEGLARIFETINSTGMNLSVFDLLVARLGSWKNGEAKTNLRSLLVDSVDEEVLKKFDEIPSLGGTASQQVPRVLALKSGIDLKKGEILKTKKDVFLEHIYTLPTGLNAALDSLTKDMGVLDSTYLPSKDAISIIAAIHSEEWSNQKEMVMAFLWSIYITIDWGRATNEKVKKAYQQLTKLLSGEEKPDVIINMLEEKFPDFEALLDVGSKSHILFRTLMTFNLSKGGADWKSNHRTTDIVLEDHHIFPKDWINSNRVQSESKEGWNSVRDSILNRMLVSKEANQSIRAQSPPTYLKDLSEVNRHLLQIPDSFVEPIVTPISLDDFKGHLSNRYELIRADFLDKVKTQLASHLALKSRSP